MYVAIKKSCFNKCIWIVDDIDTLDFIPEEVHSIKELDYNKSYVLLIVTAADATFLLDFTLLGCDTVSIRSPNVSSKIINHVATYARRVQVRLEDFSVLS